MDLKYMMLKDRYRFVYESRSAIFTMEDGSSVGKEISLFIKELTLWGVNLIMLSKYRPKAHIKDELLNIAFACIEEKQLFNVIKNKRELPVKRIASYTYKSKTFIEKWQNYILAYILLFSNNSYTQLREYLNIEKRNSSASVPPESRALTKSSNTDIDSGTITGIILLSLKDRAFILTPYGDFTRIKPSGTGILRAGYLCKGKIKGQITFYKYPVAAGILLGIMFFMLTMFMYLHSSHTVLIDANSSIKLEINNWNRIVKISPLSPNGNKITDSTKLFNVSMDNGIYLILKESKELGFLKDSTKISIYISGSEGFIPILTKTETYIMDNKLSVQINNNGVEHILKSSSLKN